MKFGDLRAGDVMTLAGQKAVLLAVEKPHPLNSSFNMYVWWIFGEGPRDGLSFDMLAPGYELFGDVHQDGLVSFKQAMHEIGKLRS